MGPTIMKLHSNNYIIFMIQQNCELITLFELSNKKTIKWIKLYLYSIDHNKIAINNQLITNEIFT